MYKIESDIPAEAPQRKNESKWDFAKTMRVGDSFLIPTKDIKSRNTAHTAVAAIRKRYGFKMTTRMTPEGARVWRVE